VKQGQQDHAEDTPPRFQREQGVSLLIGLILRQTDSTDPTISLYPAI